MIEMVKFTVPGAPKGKGRPRFSSRNGKVRTYTPDTTASYEDLVRMEYGSQCSGISFGDGPVAVTILAKFPIPKSVTKQRRAAMLRHERPAKKPDADNIAKIVCDALNGIAYDDDAQVVSLKVEKMYAAEPMVCVVITAADTEQEAER